MNLYISALYEWNLGLVKHLDIFPLMYVMKITDMKAWFSLLFISMK